MKRDARLDGLISARKMRASLAMTALRAERDKLQLACLLYTSPSPRD